MAYTGYTCVRVESSGRIVTVVIDDPPLNLIKRDLLDELGELPAELAVSATARRIASSSPEAVLVTGYVLPVDSGVTIH
jgi:enoyl-CoA hydratase/carnithine racemase